MRTNAQLQAVKATPELLNDQEQDQFVTFSPSSRGKFSHDRETWERIHQQRYQQWQLGDSVDAIAAEHGVTYNAVKHSIQWCEARMRSADVLAGRGMRFRLTAVATLAEKYVSVLGDLMSDPNPFVRSKALEHFRRTTGIESGGVQIKTELSIQNNLATGLTFEERIERIHRAQMLAPEKPTLALPSGPDQG